MGHYWHILLHTESGAQRLTCFGLGVMIAWLLWLRHRDQRTGRVPGPTERPAQSMAPPLVWVAAFLFTAMIMAITALAVLGRLPRSLFDTEAVPTHMMFIPINMIAVIFIDRLAYHPAKKWKWCAGWFLLAHLVQWGGFFFGHH